MNIYVGNLPYSVQEDELRKAFENYGEVTNVSLIKDRFTGEPRGFGFVEMASRDEGMEALAGLNGTDFGGRTLKVNEARPREERRGGRGGDGGDRRNWS